MYKHRIGKYPPSVPTQSALSKSGSSRLKLYALPTGSASSAISHATSHNQNPLLYPGRLSDGSQQGETNLGSNPIIFSQREERQGSQDLFPQFYPSQTNKAPLSYPAYSTHAMSNPVQSGSENGNTATRTSFPTPALHRPQSPTTQISPRIAVASSGQPNFSVPSLRSCSFLIEPHLPTHLQYLLAKLAGSFTHANSVLSLQNAQDMKNIILHDYSPQDFIEEMNQPHLTDQARSQLVSQATQKKFDQLDQYCREHLHVNFFLNLPCVQNFWEQWEHELKVNQQVKRDLQIAEVKDSSMRELEMQRRQLQQMMAAPSTRALPLHIQKLIAMIEQLTHNSSSQIEPHMAIGLIETIKNYMPLLEKTPISNNDVRARYEEQSILTVIKNYFANYYHMDLPECFQRVQTSEHPQFSALNQQSQDVRLGSRNYIPFAPKELDSHIASDGTRSSTTSFIMPPHVNALNLLLSQLPKETGMQFSKEMCQELSNHIASMRIENARAGRDAPDHELIQMVSAIFSYLREREIAPPKVLLLLKDYIQRMEKNQSTSYSLQVSSKDLNRPKVCLDPEMISLLQELAQDSTERLPPHIKQMLFSTYDLAIDPLEPLPYEDVLGLIRTMKNYWPRIHQEVSRSDLFNLNSEFSQNTEMDLMFGVIKEYLGKCSHRSLPPALQRLQQAIASQRQNINEKLNVLSHHVIHEPYGSSRNNFQSIPSHLHKITEKNTYLQNPVITTVSSKENSRIQYTPQEFRPSNPSMFFHPPSDQ